MAGRQFLQIPGPTNVPDRVLRAMDRALIDHRGAEMPGLTFECVEGLRGVFRTTGGRIAIWAGTGSGAWEAAIVNTLEAGDRVLSFNNGLFSEKFAAIARRFGVIVDEHQLRWGDVVTPELVATRLRAEHRALLLVHNETSTGVTCDLAGIRRAVDGTGLDPLLLVDAISSLGSIDVRFDEWRLDVAFTASQKGLMTPPGLGICCISDRAVERSASVSTPRSFYDWRLVLEPLESGYFPATAPTLQLFGLREALRMIAEEGLDCVLQRHARLAAAVRAAVAAWDLAPLCSDPSAYSNSVTAVVCHDVDTENLRRVAASELQLALGGGIGPTRGRVFRIGHLGSLNELEILATVGGIELALRRCGVPVELGAGAAAAERSLVESWA